MRTPIRTGSIAIVAVVCGLVLAADETDLRNSLLSGDIEEVRITLNPWGGHLGFETEIAGSDARIVTLTELIRNAEPGGGHKCPNAGRIRFRMADGTVVDFGLLPSHTEGDYALRMYDGDRLVGVFRFERASLLAALERLDVPMDDPAFRE